MIEDLLIHRATIRRPTHTITGHQKATGSALVATGVVCRLEPAEEGVTQSIIGIGVSSPYRGWFARGTNIRARDLVTWTDRTPTVELVVESVADLPSMDAAGGHHIEAALKRTPADVAP